MDNTRKITIVCWAISTLALLGLAIWFIVGFHGATSRSMFRFDTGMFDVVGSHSVPVQNVDTISIDWISGAVYVGAYSGDTIQITEFARHSLRDGEQLSYNINNGVLEIRFSENRIIRGNAPTKQLEILIPYALSQDLNMFDVNNVAGRSIVSDIHADALAITTVSGRVELSNSSANSVEVATMSGRIELSNVEASDIGLQTVSGNIRTVTTHAQSIITDTISGRHELGGSFHDVVARSTSGRVEIESRIVPERIDARTSSGRIEIRVPSGEVAIGVMHSTGSGRFSSQIPVTTHAGADAQFNLSTGSGRIGIYELLR